MASILNANAGGVVVTASGSAAITIQAGGVDAIQVGTGQTVTITNAAFTNATATSANITTLTGSSANITTLTGTTFGTTATTQLRSASADITTLTGSSMNVTTATHASANITTLTGTSATISTILDANGNVRDIPRSGTAKTSVYTLAITDIGEYIELGTGGGIDVPNGIFSTGNAVSIYNNTTGNRTISLTITTAYIAGTDADKASVTLATRGVASILFISNSVCVVTGNVS